MERLFIIDVMALVFKNFHAFGGGRGRPLTTSAGLPTSAIYGTAVFLQGLIQDERPDYLMAATDSKEATFRHEIYDGYKANRSEMPEELRPQIPYVYELLESMGIPLLKVPGLEADDLIGSLVSQLPNSITKYIVSGDKDFLQLVRDDVLLYTTRKGEAPQIRGPKDVEERFGIAPAQLIDVMALWGDKADNIPGVAGVGEKKASKLIQEFGSIEQIYSKIEDVANMRLRQQLLDARDDAELSKRLVTIVTDAEVNTDLQDLRLDHQQALGSKEIFSFYDRMEFRRLKEAVAAYQGDSAVDPSEAKAPAQQEDPTQQDYQLVDDAAQLKRLIDALEEADTYAVDTETTGLDIISHRPIGISFSTTFGQGWYVTLEDRYLKGMSAADVLSQLQPLLGDSSKIKVGHNLKFDIQMLSNIGVEVKGRMADTMIAAHLLQPGKRGYSLDACCLSYLDYKKIPTSELMGKDKKTPMLEVPLDQLVTYACEDADLTLRLYRHLEAKLAESELTEVFEGVEMPLVVVLAKMEQRGVYLDIEAITKLSQKLAVELKDIETLAYREAGEEFNLSSPKQLQAILFEKLKIHEQLGVKRLKKTKTGISTDASVLEKLSEHPLPAALLEHRMLAKLKNTYTDVLPQLIHKKSGRIHSSFHQAGTATGRLSSSDPNLQNIPIRSNWGREVRKTFTPQGKDYLLVAADYSQVELRLLAHMADEENLIAAFKADADIHENTAQRIFATDKVSSDQRSQAKAINFGLIYGMGPERLGRETGVSTKEAKAFIQKYFATYPRIETYITQAVEYAKEHGYCKTIRGRRRDLPEINGSNPMLAAAARNMAINSPIQGSASELIKLAMVTIENQLSTESIDAKMLLQVHDELIFEVHKDHYSMLAELVCEHMESAMQLKVPLKVNIGSGQNWLEAH